MSNLISGTTKNRSMLIAGIRILWTIGTLIGLSVVQPSLIAPTWIFIAIFAIVGNLLIAIVPLILAKSLFIGLLSVVYDSIFVLLILGYTHDPFLVIYAGTMAIALTGAGYSRQLSLVAAVIIQLGVIFALVKGSASDGVQLFHFILTLLFLSCVALVIDFLSTIGVVTNNSEVEALRLRGARERIESAYQIVNVANTAEDYQQALDTFLNFGILSAQRAQKPGRLMGIIFLIDAQLDKQRIYVAAAQGLNKSDQDLLFLGQRGILALALRQTQPIFALDVSRDPELSLLSGLKTAQSIVAIPLRQQYRTFGVLMLASEARDAFSEDDLELCDIIGAQITTTLHNARLYQELRQEQTRLIEAEEEARKKLSRDLHDGPTQSIAVIAMRLNYIRALIERQPDLVRDELYKTEEIARRTSREIRHMLFTLRPLVLETQGLTAALRQLADKMRETHNQAVIIEAGPEIDTLFPPNIQGVLFYIAEEAVNNARKHAQAAHIWVRLIYQMEQVVLEIQDDGKGFDIAAMTDGYDKRSSLGMINMRERTEMLEGHLEMTSAPGRGTKISITVPLSPAEAQTEPVADTPVESQPFEQGYDNLQERLDALTTGRPIATMPVNPSRSPTS